VVGTHTWWKIDQTCDVYCRCRRMMNLFNLYKACARKQVHWQSGDPSFLDPKILATKFRNRSVGSGGTCTHLLRGLILYSKKEENPSQQGQLQRLFGLLDTANSSKRKVDKAENHHEGKSVCERPSVPLPDGGDLSKLYPCTATTGRRTSSHRQQGGSSGTSTV
jgi:hypothetical protein